MHNTNTWLTRIAASVLMLISAFVGGGLALVTAQSYAIIVRAILGFSVIYLVVQQYLLSDSSKNEKKNDVHLLFEFPNNIKYFILMFIWSLISTWAALQIEYMIFSYVKK